MQFQWKPSLSRAVAAVMFAVAATSSAYAMPKGPCEKPEPCCDEPKPGPFAFNYPMDLGIACPRDFYVYGEGLAFQAKQDGMEFALRDSSTGAPLNNGEVLGFDSDHTDWDYNPGARFGVGTYLNHDAWNAEFSWTWVNVTNYRSVSATSSGSLIDPMWLMGINSAGTGSGVNTVNANAVWTASYNVLDAKLGKPYNVSRYFVFNPFFGVRAAWIDQHFSVDYGMIVSETTTVGAPATQVANPINHGDQDFWGFGGRAGFNTDYIIGKGWCLFGNLSASMIFGKFDVTHRVDPTSGGADGGNLERNSYQNIPNLEMALGIGWNAYFDDNKYRISAKAAYEFIEWFGLNNFRKFYSGNPSYINTPVRGNFTMNGFSLRLQLDI